MNVLITILMNRNNSNNCITKVITDTNRKANTIIYMIRTNITVTTNNILTNSIINIITSNNKNLTTIMIIIIMILITSMVIIISGDPFKSPK